MVYIFIFFMQNIIGFYQFLFVADLAFLRYVILRIMFFLGVSSPTSRCARVGKETPKKNIEILLLQIPI